MDNSNKKKDEQLGMSHSTANSVLKKVIMYELVKKLNMHFCYQCGLEIEKLEEFSVEHKIPWLDSQKPRELFFDTDNIAFSHLLCNIKAARQTRPLKHPSQETYKRGCRCDECKEIQKLVKRVYRAKKL